MRARQREDGGSRGLSQMKRGRAGRQLHKADFSAEGEVLSFAMSKRLEHCFLPVHGCRGSLSVWRGDPGRMVE